MFLTTKGAQLPYIKQQLTQRFPRIPITILSLQFCVPTKGVVFLNENHIALRKVQTIKDSISQIFFNIQHLFLKPLETGIVTALGPEIISPSENLLH